VNGIPCGALTYYFVKNLTKMPKETPLVQVVEATAKELASERYSQVPQAEGQRKDKPFLG
jgi:DNA-binding transcriptional regulator YbjK